MKRHLLILLFVCGLLGGCSKQRDVIVDEQTLARVEARLASRADWLPALPDGLSEAQSEALKFLYAYLPVGDVADYSTEFYLQNINTTLQASDEMPWGRLVPEREFLHFVLPVRVNNEALDTSRLVFFDELKERVKGMTMKEAILEVNHWCHEKVNYSPTDARTMSPLALVTNATGRCGEESTFTVAALRAVGIPARQIYVPRWAHTDDNHAWVEAWATETPNGNKPSEGKWYYIGACEPEPVLNTGWFDAPAKRSLLMMTKVFGEYVGSEQILLQTDGYTEISVTENYAPVRKVTVALEDKYGLPVQGAKVLYTIYNYATYYPAASQTTDQNGNASFTAGLGDMVIFASDKGLVASAVADFRTMDTLHIKLGELPSTTVDLDIVPPAEQPIESAVSGEARAANDVRFAAEDSVRSAYIATFITRQASNEIATEVGADTTRLWNIMSKTRGNHSQIATFLLNVARENIPSALDLLEVISVKDLCDTPVAVLLDHLNASIQFVGRPFFKEYILNPRVDNELLTPYRSSLQTGDTTLGAMAIIGSLADIAIVDSLNPARLAISPLGVKQLKMGDKTSVERLIITSLRSNGIAARREPISKRLQYFEGGVWHYITSDEQQVIPAKGQLMVEVAKNSTLKNPKLDTHFTIGKWNGSSYVPVQFESLGVDMGGEATLSQLFDQPLSMEEGHYMLTTGTRLASGSVLARNVPIEIKKGVLSKIALDMRSSNNELSVIGAINLETKYFPKGSSSAVPLIATTGRGYCLVAMIDAKKEPTTHFMRALSRQKKVLEKWGRPIVLILRDKGQLESLNLKDFPPLPSTVSFGYDDGSKVSSMIGEMCEIKDMARLPVVTIGDSFGRVIYISTGYNTSLDEQITTIIELL